MRPDAPLEAHRSVGDLVRELGEEISTLIRAEISLAKMELSEKTRPVAASAGFFGGAALVGIGAFGALTAGAIAALALVVDVWAAALIVAVVYAIVAYALVIAGKKKLQEAGSLVPTQTAQTVKEDIEWAKTRTKSGAR